MPWQQPVQANSTGEPIVMPLQVQTDTVSQAQTDTSGAAGEEINTKLDEIRNLISFGVIFLTLFILVLTYFLNKFVVQILDNISEKSAKYRLFTKRLVPVVRITIWSFSLYIIIAGIINPPFETVLTVTASIGIAVGFASQDILKNVFGGFIIILDRPFQVGDKIEVGNYYGEVLQIGLRSCRIVTPDDSIVTIPNGELMSKSVSNANSSA
ncbi:MAG TPA: mechanosensitive ion channel domain-containing protein, partial [Halalkalibaculum sp.]|nr:mechanosensitive ion channel domain-containing protein [Halalkalibaculum sp.]